MTDPRRKLPAVDTLLEGPGVVALLAAHPRGLVVRAVRETVDAARANGGSAPAEGWDAAITTGALGAFWAVLYLKRRSAVAPIVSHAGFNTAEILRVLLVG